MSTRSPGRTLRGLRRFLLSGDAVSALEYAMVVGIVAVTLSAALVVFSDEITKVFSTIGPVVGSQSIGSVTKLE